MAYRSMAVFETCYLCNTLGQTVSDRTVSVAPLYGSGQFSKRDRGGHPESSRQGFAQVARAEAGVREARSEMGEQSKLGGLK